MKIPKHITDALGRPRFVCPAEDCGVSVEITAKGTIARHRRRLDPYASVCAESAWAAPSSAALEWARAVSGKLRAQAEEFRAEAQKATANAARHDAMAAELEKVIARESGKGNGQ